MPASRKLGGKDERVLQTASFVEYLAACIQDEILPSYPAAVFRIDRPHTHDTV